MSTTSIYGAMFLIPLPMTDTPLGFSILSKGVDEFGVESFYSYNEYMALAGNKAFYTPSGTHALLSENITSANLREDVNAQIAGSPFVFVDGSEIDQWQDAYQTYYIWCITTDKRMSYSYEKFIAESPLGIEPIVVP